MESTIHARLASLQTQNLKDRKELEGLQEQIFLGTKDGRLFRRPTARRDELKHDHLQANIDARTDEVLHTCPHARECLGRIASRMGERLAQRAAAFIPFTVHDIADEILDPSIVEDHEQVEA
jgi:hypothetical protein